MHVSLIIHGSTMYLNCVEVVKNHFSYFKQVDYAL